MADGRDLPPSATVVTFLLVWFAINLASGLFNFVPGEEGQIAWEAHIGGFLVGFGARWAGGCTSGHAISGLADFQLPSLVAVVGFFVGGLAVTHFLLPFLLG